MSDMTQLRYDLIIGYKDRKRLQQVTWILTL